MDLFKRQEWQRKRGIEKEQSEIFKKNYGEKSHKLYKRIVVKTSHMLLSIMSFISF